MILDEDLGFTFRIVRILTSSVNVYVIQSIPVAVLFIFVLFRFWS